MKDFRLVALIVNVIWNFCTIFKCEILMLGKFVSIIASCSLCTAEVESVEAEGIIRLTGRQPPG
jgi:hypothetical protein